MKQKEIEKALEGHENREEILALLAESVDPMDHNDRKNGYIVGQQGSTSEESDVDWIEGGTIGDPLHTTHRLAHWESGFDAEQHARHDRKHSEARAKHGLQFLERPNGKGRYATRGPKARAQIQENYREQIKAEQEGEHWSP